MYFRCPSCGYEFRKSFTDITIVGKTQVTLIPTQNGLNLASDRQMTDIEVKVSDTPEISCPNCGHKSTPEEYRYSLYCSRCDARISKNVNADSTNAEIVRRYCRARHTIYCNDCLRGVKCRDCSYIGTCKAHEYKTTLGR